MKNLFKALFLVSAMVSQPSYAQSTQIALQCIGLNKSDKGDCAFSASGQMACWSNPTQSGETIFVRIQDGQGKVQIPATLFRLKGDGWVDIDQLVVGEQYITGQLPLSSLTKPNLKIDRFSGSLDLVSGSLLGTSFKFSASCRKAELEVRKF